MRRGPFIAILLLLPIISSAGTSYTARNLYTAVTAGVPFLERGKNGGILHIKHRKLTKQEKRQLKELAQLGYVDGTAGGSQRAALAIEHKSGSVESVTISLAKFDGRKCLLHMAVMDAKGKRVYKKDTTVKDASERDKEGARKLSFDVGHKGEGPKSTIKLRFDGCEVAIKEILVE